MVTSIVSQKNTKINRRNTKMAKQFLTDEAVEEED
jgi:hypothetical protein